MTESTWKAQEWVHHKVPFSNTLVFGPRLMLKLRLALSKEFAIVSYRMIVSLGAWLQFGRAKLAAEVYTLHYITTQSSFTDKEYIAWNQRLWVSPYTRPYEFGTCLVHDLFNLLPVTSPLDELIHAGMRVNRERTFCMAGDLLFWSECCPVSRNILHDLCEIFRIRNDVDVPDHFQIGKILRDSGLLQRSHKGVICVEVGYHLESSLQRDDLALDMAL